jgi:hypothetical protein
MEREDKHLSIMINALKHAVKPHSHAHSHAAESHEPHLRHNNTTVTAAANTTALSANA